ncbi:hypothetical protein Ae201684P_014453 [Aphanomyces euteiches]|nr:hypothetical protein Ae201684P_014344 [Aphanomyces euteiches]KAH9090658.1 hypothetical protein Ae201684P_014453 [Aphanomyces euteiches]
MFTSIPTFLLALTSIALGHGYLNDPLPTYFPGTKDVTSFCGTMDSPKVLPGHQYKGSPEYNANAFTIHFKASTLKALVAANDGGCGTCSFSDANGTPRQLPADGNVYWHTAKKASPPRTKVHVKSGATTPVSTKTTTALATSPMAPCRSTCQRARNPTC